MKSNEEMSSVLKKLSEDIAAAKKEPPKSLPEDKPKEKEPKKEAKPEKSDEDEGGWASVQAYFMGKPGVNRAKKFIKFLSMLNELEDS